MPLNFVSPGCEQVLSEQVYGKCILLEFGREMIEWENNPGRANPNLI